MAIKTPQEVAAETVLLDFDDEWTVREGLEAILDARDDRTPDEILSLIVAAIEADRKQRIQAARTWRAADRPMGVVRGWGDVLITRVNSRSVYFRAPNVLGELASPINDLIEIKGA